MISVGATDVGRSFLFTISSWCANIVRAISASSVAVYSRCCARVSRFFARANLSLVASIWDSVRKIFAADCLVGSRPMSRRCFVSLLCKSFRRVR